MGAGEAARAPTSSVCDADCRSQLGLRRVAERSLSVLHSGLFLPARQDISFHESSCSAEQIGTEPGKSPPIQGPDGILAQKVSRGIFFCAEKTRTDTRVGRTGDDAVSRLLRIPQEKRKGETKRPEFDKEALHLSSSKLLRNRKRASNRYENDEFHQRQLMGAPNFFLVFKGPVCHIRLNL